MEVGKWEFSKRIDKYIIAQPPERLDQVKVSYVVGNLF